MVKIDHLATGQADFQGAVSAPLCRHHLTYLYMSIRVLLKLDLTVTHTVLHRLICQVVGGQETGQTETRSLQGPSREPLVKVQSRTRRPRGARGWTQPVLLQVGRDGHREQMGTQCFWAPGVR